MLDLPHFYTTHRDRLRKRLPDTFLCYEPAGDFYLNDVPGQGSTPFRWLSNAEASVFLEHAARRVLEEAWEKNGEGFHVRWVTEVGRKNKTLSLCYFFTDHRWLSGDVEPVEAIAAALDTLFHPSQEPG